jgi:hypothetical protein
MINHYIEKSPPEPISDLSRYQYFILDGTFIQRPRSLVALMDAQTHTLVTGKYAVSESSGPQLRVFLGRLKEQGLQPHSFTVDGNPNLTNTLRSLWPGVTVQRCLVHIQRQGLVWCRNVPKTTYARKLRRIFLKVTRIRTEEERDTFLKLIGEWENKYGSQIRYRPETGYVFSDIKRARSMLLRALPDMFHYLDDPLIPISTNSLEGYFSRLKSRYRQHRGLSRRKRNNYFQWYFYYVPK